MRGFQKWSLSFSCGGSAVELFGSGGSVHPHELDFLGIPRFDERRNATYALCWSDSLIGQTSVLASVA